MTKPGISQRWPAYGMHRIHHEGRAIHRVPAKDFGIKSPADA
jgi:hypothetical protein